MKPTDFQVNEDKPMEKLYSNFKLLDGDNVKNADGEFRFKLRFPNDEEKSNAIVWKQKNNPLEEEVSGFEGQSLGMSSDFQGLFKSEDADCICQSSDGFELGVQDEHSD